MKHIDDSIIYEKTSIELYLNISFALSNGCIIETCLSQKFGEHQMFVTNMSQ